jgi:hypothetical protein
MGDAGCPPAGTLSWGFSLCIRPYFLGKDFFWQRLSTEGVPPSPLPFGIMGLGRNSRKIFGFKGVAGKFFQNQ